MNVRVRAAVLLGSMLVASILLGVGAPSATAAAPAGYAPGSPAGSEYQEQLATAREIGVRDREQPRSGSASDGGSLSSLAQRDAASRLFGAGVTPGDGRRGSRAGAADDDVATPSGGGSEGAVTTSAAAAASERSAIAAAASAPLEGPSSALITGLLGAAALLVAGMLAVLLRRQG